MYKFKLISSTGFLLTLVFSALAQEKDLTVRAGFSYKKAASKAEVVHPFEVNAILAKGGITENKIYSKNGNIEARIQTPSNYNSETETYSVFFTDKGNEVDLGTFANIAGELFPSNDGKHFISFYRSSGSIRLYTYNNKIPIHAFDKIDAEDVALSWDGSKFLVAEIKGYSVVLHCFSIEGEELWSKQFPNTNLAKIAISHNGKYSALSAYLLDPEKTEKIKERSRIIEEARRKWKETNRQRREQNLPEIEFVPPVFPKLQKKTVSDKLRRNSKTLIFLDVHGSEIGRTSPSLRTFTNLTLSKRGGTYLAAYNGIEVHIFDAADARLLHKRKLPTATEVTSLDVSRDGQIAFAAITHPTRNQRGWIVDQGLADPRLLFLWNTSKSEIRSYKFSSILEIPRNQFFVHFPESKDKLLAQAGNEIFVFEK